MGELFWAYENQSVRSAGALPPVPLDLVYGMPSGPPVKDVQRAAALGRPVTPADCGPVRVISRYGFVVRCPGEVVLQRAEPPQHDRHFGENRAAFGSAVVAGGRWPQGDSGFIASWIAGSEYVKVQTGVMVFFPEDTYLYQGPLPNAQLLDGPVPDVMAAMEYPSRDRLWPLRGRRVPWASVNVIVRLPPLGMSVHIVAGAPLCWFFSVAPRPQLKLEKLPSVERTEEPG